MLGYFAQVVQRAATAEDLFALHAGISLTREGLAALSLGEASFEQGAFGPATLSFQKALGAGVPVSLFAEHAARAWLALKDCAHADGMVSAAQRLDPESPDTVALVRDGVDGPRVGEARRALNRQPTRSSHENHTGCSARYHSRISRICSCFFLGRTLSSMRSK